MWILSHLVPSANRMQGGRCVGGEEATDDWNNYSGAT